MAIERRDPSRFDWPDLFTWPWPERGLLFDRWRDLFGSGIKVEEYIEGDDQVVRAELPGVDPDKDVSISVSGGALHISAERREQSKEESRGGYRSEFRYGALHRSIPLPAGASEDDVRASYQDGILEVRVRRPQLPEGGKRIPISRSG